MVELSGPVKHEAASRRRCWYVSSMLIGVCSTTEKPYESKTVKGDDAMQLIDSMRAKGFYEAAQQRLSATAKTIAERITAAVPGQSWKFDDDPSGQNISRQGLPCEKLTGDIARRPLADSVVFGRTLNTEEFVTAHDIVRQEAAQHGATDESSLFNEQSRRDYDVQGNGFEFKLGQAKVATLNMRRGPHRTLASKGGRPRCTKLPCLPA